MYPPPPYIFPTNTSFGYIIENGVKIFKLCVGGRGNGGRIYVLISLFLRVICIVRIFTNKTP